MTTYWKCSFPDTGPHPIDRSVGTELLFISRFQGKSNAIVERLSVERTLSPALAHRTTLQPSRLPDILATFGSTRPDAPPLADLGYSKT